MVGDAKGVGPWDEGLEKEGPDVERRGQVGGERKEGEADGREGTRAFAP